MYLREDKIVAGTTKALNAIKYCLKPSISQPVYEKKHFLKTLIHFHANLAGTGRKANVSRFALDDRLIARADHL